MIESRIEYRPVVDGLRRAAAEMRNAAPMMRSVAGTMFAAVEQNFAQEGRPKWKDLHPGTKTARTKEGTWPGKILQRSGGLASSITQKWTATTAQVGSNKVYAAIQQFGGRTKAHVIRPKNKKALSFGGIVVRTGTVVRSVNHPGSNIPARPYLRLTPRDLKDIVEDAQAFYERAVVRNAARGGAGGGT